MLSSYERDVMSLFRNIKKGPFNPIFINFLKSDKHKS